MALSKEQRGLHKTKAIIFDFDGTLAVLNIDFGFMREQVFDLIRSFGIAVESIRQNTPSRLLTVLRCFKRIHKQRKNLSESS
jgi:hypothetical protein